MSPDQFDVAARDATAKMRSVFPATPLLRNDLLSQRFDADVWLKREDLSPVGSYKLRGAITAMRKVVSANDVFVCASAGNHAQGMAYMCRHFGAKGVIFMPVTTPAQKIMKTQMFGGEYVEIKLVGDYFDETLQASKEYCAACGAYFLSPFDDDDVIEGQASVAVEIEEQLGRLPDRIILPVGGGGLSAGVLRFVRADCDFTFVEPTGAQSLKLAVKNGSPKTVQKIDNFVDGAAVARIGERNFEHLRHIDINDVLHLNEDRICKTMLEMLNVEGIVLEPAGALSVDVLSEVRDQIKGKTVVCITSGGNFDFERLPEVKERAQRYTGLKKYFILRLPQRPGALKDFLNILGPDDDIARFEYLKKSARNFGSVLIGIETTNPENFELLFQRIGEGGFGFTDITNDEALTQFLI